MLDLSHPVLALFALVTTALHIAQADLDFGDGTSIFLLPFSPIRIALPFSVCYLIWLYCPLIEALEEKDFGVGYIRSLSRWKFSRTKLVLLATKITGGSCALNVSVDALQFLAHVIQRCYDNQPKYEAGKFSSEMDWLLFFAVFLPLMAAVALALVAVFWLPVYLLLAINRIEDDVDKRTTRNISGTGHPENTGSKLSHLKYALLPCLASLLATLHIVRPGLTYKGMPPIFASVFLWPLSPTRIAVPLSICYLLWLDTFLNITFYLVPYPTTPTEEWSKLSQTKNGVYKMIPILITGFMCACALSSDVLNFWISACQNSYNNMPPYEFGSLSVEAEWAGEVFSLLFFLAVLMGVTWIILWRPLTKLSQPYWQIRAPSQPSQPLPTILARLLAEWKVGVDPKSYDWEATENASLADSVFGHGIADPQSSLVDVDPPTTLREPAVAPPSSYSHRLSARQWAAASKVARTLQQTRDRLEEFQRQMDICRGIYDDLNDREGDAYAGRKLYERLHAAAEGLLAGEGKKNMQEGGMIRGGKEGNKCVGKVKMGKEYTEEKMVESENAWLVVDSDEEARMA